MPKQLEQILLRIKADAPHATEVREIVTAIFSAVDAYEAKAKVHAADKNLSRDGALAKAREALPSTLEAVKSHAAALTRMSTSLADNERGLHAKIAPRPADVLKYAQHAEIRGYISALPEASKLPFLMKHIDNADVREAVLGIPFPELAGMSSDKLEVFRTAVLEKYHGAEVEQIDAARETLAVGEAGKAVALQALRSAADVSEREFAAMLEGKDDNPAKPSGGKGKTMTEAEFDALPEIERRMMHAGRVGRMEAYERGEKWAREMFEQDRAAFLWPPYNWSGASA